ncbi:hypothetical protein P4640_27760 [Priestia aryabhattai]|uniref:hypothetical protein n=1 Tax=Priestia aryabhattai TaxID=412384 RepID=UPI002E1F1E11|nr:hypothetical protein [Priestia aryabhattai]
MSFDAYRNRMRRELGLDKIEKLVEEAQALLQGELNHTNYNEWVSQGLVVLEGKQQWISVTQRFKKITDDDLTTSKENLEKLTGLLKGLIQQ